MLPASYFWMLLVLLCAVALGQNTVRFGMVREKGTVLGDIDQSFIDGFVIWKTWTEQNGGLVIAGENYSMELITEIAAENISNDTPDSVRQPLMEAATERLLLNHSIDVLMGPFGTARTYWVVSKKNELVGDSIPFLSVGGGGINIYSTGSKNLWGNTAPPPDQPNTILELVAEASEYFDGSSVSRVGVLGKGDGGYYESGYNNAIIALGNHSDVYDVVFQSLYPSTLQTDDLVQAQLLMDPLKESRARIALLTGGIAQDTQTIVALFKSFGYRPALFAVMSPLDSFDVNLYSSISPEYWVYATYFHPDMGAGIEGKNLGLSSQYPEIYESILGKPFLNLRTPTASSLCIAWQLGAQRAGANWRNSTEFIRAMKSLDGGNSTESFIGPFRFTEQGLNVERSYKYIQFQYENGELEVVLIKEAKDLVYPAPWAWGDDGSDDDDIDTAATVGIVIGAFAGFVLLLLVVILVAALVFVVVWKKFFHLILFEKGAEVKESGDL